MNIMLAAALADGMTVVKTRPRSPISWIWPISQLYGGPISWARARTSSRSVGWNVWAEVSTPSYPIRSRRALIWPLWRCRRRRITNVIPKHLDCITAKLEEMGVEITEGTTRCWCAAIPPAVSRTNIKTLPYPGFPTDMQPQIAVALCLAEGTSVITEGVWDSRYRYVDEIHRLGLRSRWMEKVAVIEGVDRLTGAPVQACDLRAGAAMVIAGLAAHGTTEVDQIQYIERGYEDIVRKLSGLGPTSAWWSPPRRKKPRLPLDEPWRGRRLLPPPALSCWGAVFH